jgi:hypothetical protein
MEISFQENKDRYFNCLSNNHFIFELTKCCNYTEWVTILKNYTVSDLYRTIKNVLCNQNIRLFVKDQYNNVLHLFESDLIIKQLIHSNSTFFTPVYPLPYQVVYKIYIDDGHNHIH